MGGAPGRRRRAALKRLLLATLVAAVAAPAARAATPPIAAEPTFTPLVHAFADPVTARLTLAVDSARIDPGSVRVRPSFAPYRAGPAQVERSGAEAGLVVLRYAYPLSCSTAACVPGATERTFTLRDALVLWRYRSGRAGSARVAWPPLAVASRLTPRDLAAPALVGDVAPPAPAYAVPPGLLAGVLDAVGAALVAGGIVGLVLLLRPRARPAATPPVDHALELVEQAAAGEVVGRRRALYRLALALEQARLEPESWAARKLAWAPAAPETDGMLQLALVIRGQLHEEEP